MAFVNLPTFALLLCAATIAAVNGTYSVAPSYTEMSFSNPNPVIYLQPFSRYLALTVRITAKRLKIDNRVRIRKRHFGILVNVKTVLFCHDIVRGNARGNAVRTINGCNSCSTKHCEKGRVTVIFRNCTSQLDPLHPIFAPRIICEIDLTQASIVALLDERRSSAIETLDICLFHQVSRRFYGSNNTPELTVDNVQLSESRIERFTGHQLPNKRFSEDDRCILPDPASGHTGPSPLSPEADRIRIHGLYKGYTPSNRPKQVNNQSELVI
eukprot:sb/3468202/